MLHTQMADFKDVASNYAVLLFRIFENFKYTLAHKPMHKDKLATVFRVGTG